MMTLGWISWHRNTCCCGLTVTICWCEENARVAATSSSTLTTKQIDAFFFPRQRGGGSILLSCDVCKLERSYEVVRVRVEGMIHNMVGSWKKLEEVKKSM